MSYIYLASPYSHPDDKIQKFRYEECLRVCAHYMNTGVTIFSPIVHCRPIALKYGLPHSFDFWKNYNEAMINGGNELKILMLDGWKESKGVNGEIEIATQLQKLITYLDPLLVKKEH